MKTHSWSPKNNEQRYHFPSIFLKISNWPFWMYLDYIKNFQNIWNQMVAVHLPWWSVAFASFLAIINTNRIDRPNRWYHEICCSFCRPIHMQWIIMQTLCRAQQVDRVLPPNCCVSMKFEQKLNNFNSCLDPWYDTFCILTISISIANSATQMVIMFTRNKTVKTGWTLSANSRRTLERNTVSVWHLMLLLNWILKENNSAHLFTFEWNWM